MFSFFSTGGLSCAPSFHLLTYLSLAITNSNGHNHLNSEFRVGSVMCPAHRRVSGCSRRRDSGGKTTRLGLLSYLKCIIDFDAGVSYCTFQFGMSQKQLNRSKIPDPSIDQRRFRSAHRMGAVGYDIKSDRGDPSPHDARVLSR